MKQLSPTADWIMCPFSCFLEFYFKFIGNKKNKASSTCDLEIKKKKTLGGGTRIFVLFFNLLICVSVYLYCVLVFRVLEIFFFKKKKIKKKKINNFLILNKPFLGRVSSRNGKILNPS